ncbi:PKD-like family lipoprotein [Mucilaginibacter sp. RS28]|uniref:PKD-like family lipoprotein n=1 Tax=Mucilaginibacter straminoryzae TaxID=2932774 RepID=A0A9X2BCD7_9SPHI|nr:PKD-like family lipoprotein [Mucilaginibacter straminoryzae]MCJ8209208.1 PKD-like family lipoprotein [Mucilaginibacter straminoryzae]
MKIYLYTLFLGCVCLLSCKKDKQDFKYAQLNEVTIKTDSAITITQFDTLKLDPVITESKPSGESYSYQWKIYSVTPVEGISSMVLSTDKAIKAVISYPPLRDGYNLEYKVTNKSNGVSAFKTFSLQVTSVFKDGWLVSSTKGNTAGLDFIRSDYRVFYSPATAVNRTAYTGNAVAAYAYPSSYGAKTSIGFFTDNGNYIYDANSFLESGKSTTGFTPVKGQFTFGLTRYGSEEYIINNGDLFGASVIDDPINVTFTDRIGGDYSLFPKVIKSTYFITYFFDNKYKRFMYTTFGDFGLNPVLGSSSAAFNMGNTGMTMVGASDGPQDVSTGTYYFIMQDNVGNRYIYSLNGGKPVLKQQMQNSPEIASAKTFASSLFLNQMYYATDNKLYVYDILSNSSKLIYTFPAGVLIKQMVVQPNDARKLVIATNIGTSGSVYFFQLDNLGNIVNNSYVQKIDGFGAIANIDYRKPN